MPTDLVRLNQTKEKIISTIRMRGPSLPAHVAKSIDTTPLFASAFLSELYSEKKIKISNLKVGSSPLYYLEGQEHLLENYSQYLNSREKQALDLLKNEKVLDDSDLEPVIRVALRSIKDFAKPIKVRIESETKLLWKYFPITNIELNNYIQEKFVKKEISQTTQDIRIPQVNEEKTKIPEVAEEIKNPEKIPDLEKNKKSIENISIPQKKTKIQKPLDFSVDIRKFLDSHEIELIKLISEKKKEFEALIRIDTKFGKQSYYLIAKDKKSITENDLSLAYQKALSSKMPSLIISPGELNKKAKDHIAEWNNLIKFQKIKS
jgi:hypothetical protein